MKTSTNYTNRKIDIMISDNYTDKLNLKFSNQVVTGIQKLVQIYIISLLTNIGSKLTNLLEGTKILSDLMNTNISGNIKAIIRSGIANTNEYIINNQTLITNNDEKLLDCKLNNFTVNNDTVNIQLSIISVANTGYTFILPVKIIGV